MDRVIWHGAVIAIALLASSCVKSDSEESRELVGSERQERKPKYRRRVHSKREPPPVARPTKSMSVAEAKRYLLRLVNRDREAEGLEPVAWDATAERAGQEHAEDMARRGYTAHWGSDGSVPEQRYSAAGGTGMVKENAACFPDGVERQIDGSPVVTAEEVEKIEHAFISEKPPHDGHRKNILTPWHNRLGIGLAQPVGVPIPCVAQEFVDDYGNYSSLPSSASVGQTVHVAGTMTAPATFGGIGIARIALPSAKSAAELNETHTYAVPRPYVTYFPKGYKTPITVQTDGNHFSIKVPLDDNRRPGIYEVSVWATVPEDPDLTMVGLRTIVVK